MEQETPFGLSEKEYDDLERRMHVIGQQSEHLSQDTPHAHHRPRYDGTGEFQEELEKQKTIDELCERRRLAFEKYFTETSAARQSFEGIPQEVLEYLIPKRLLEIMPDPRKVEIIPVQATSKWFATLIVDRDHFPDRTVGDIRHAYHQGWNALREQRETRDYYQTSLLNLEYTPAVYHSNVFSPQDMVCLSTQLEKGLSPDVIYYSEYLDHPSVRRQGVTAEYRTRLETLLTRLDFHYLTADTEYTYDRYYRGQGYLPLATADPALRPHLFPDPDSVRITQYFCYKRLAPSDQKKPAPIA